MMYIRRNTYMNDGIHFDIAEAHDLLGFLKRIQHPHDTSGVREMIAELEKTLKDYEAR